MFTKFHKIAGRSRATSIAFTIVAALILGVVVWCLIAWANLHSAIGDVKKQRKTLEKVYACCQEYDKMKSSSQTSVLLRATKAFNIVNLMEEIYDKAKVKPHETRPLADKAHDDIAMIEKTIVFTFKEISRRDIINIIFLFEKRNDPHVAIRNITMSSHKKTKDRKSKNVSYKFNLTITLSYFVPMSN